MELDKLNEMQVIKADLVCCIVGNENRNTKCRHGFVIQVAVIVYVAYISTGPTANILRLI